jgi:hypothetical protein
MQVESFAMQETSLASRRQIRMLKSTPDGQLRQPLVIRFPGRVKQEATNAAQYI